MSYTLLLYQIFLTCHVSQLWPAFVSSSEVIFTRTYQALTFILLQRPLLFENPHGCEASIPSVVRISNSWHPGFEVGGVTRWPFDPPVSYKYLEVVTINIRNQVFPPALAHGESSKLKVLWRMALRPAHRTANPLSTHHGSVDEQVAHLSLALMYESQKFSWQRATPVVAGWSAGRTW
jgi:hypothetical protein